MGKNLDGLSSEEAVRLLEKYGPNVLPEKPPPSKLSIFWQQLKSPLVYVLLVAGVITFFLKEYSDTAIIFLAVFINTVLGFFQETKANDALKALKGMLHPEAIVIRDGKRARVAVSKLVPGDIVVLGQGEKVPADGVLLEAKRVFVEEAILTGESAPISKSENSEVYMGTIVTAGLGIMKISITGENTKMGKIAQSIQSEQELTPLEKQLERFSKQLSVLVLGLTVLVFVVGLLGGRNLSEIFITSVALAVSAIPEGLLVALTVILAIGMQRILKKKGLVRNLVSAETLGGVTTICVDKTGTLTEGKMKVIKLVGDKKLLAKQALLSSDRDDPLVIAAYEWAERELTAKDLKGERIDDYLDKHGRIDTLPFTSKDRFAAALHRWNSKKNVIFVNGAPDFLLEWCGLTITEKQDILEVIEKLTKDGARLMGLAQKEVSTKKNNLKKEDAVSGLEWIGILAFNDPVRSGVDEALSLAQKAGIRPIVITGDYPQTAISVMHKLKLPIKREGAVLGEELKNMSEEELSKSLVARQPMLFARTTPDQKLKIVKALKKNGEVVAMTGDGVNDAPALSQADIGIAVAEATDVSKESADLVLLNSSFKTIITAVEEGRGIFDNIRKVILYLMCDAFEEIGVVILCIIAGLPLPVTASQVLWINLISDGLPNLALTVDPKRPGSMNEPPRSVKEQLVSRWMKILIFIVSAAGATMAFLIFSRFFGKGANIHQARSAAFATLGINSLFYVFSLRALKQPFWKENPLDNKWLLGAVSVGILLQIIPFTIEPVGRFLDVVPLSLVEWASVFGASTVMFILIELSKAIFRKKHI